MTTRRKPDRASIARALVPDELPPHSKEAEQGVLGCILLDPPLCLPECMARFKGEHEAFYDLKHQTIYRALLRMREQSVAVDLITLQQTLKECGKLDEVGGIAYLMSLADAVPSAANLNYYLAIVCAEYSKRQTIRLTHDALEAIKTAPAADVLARLSTAAQEILSGVPRRRLSVRTASEILQMRFDNSDNYLGDRLLATGQPLVIAGAGGVGKSRLLLQLAAASITGQDWLGIETHARGKRWLIIQGENSNRRLRDDLSRLQNWLGESRWQQVEKNLFIHTIENDRDAILGLDSSQTVSELETLIDDTKPDIIGLDVLNNFGIGDLNKDSDMRETCHKLSALFRRGNPDRALVVLHHSLTGKQGALRAVGFDRASFARNSKVLFGWTRAQINIAGTKPDNNDELLIACGKNNNGREFEPFAVQFSAQQGVYLPDLTWDRDSWEADTSGKSAGPVVDVESVVELCDGEQSKAQLAKAVQDETGCTRSTAYKWVHRAEQSRKICKSKLTGKYARKI